MARLLKTSLVHLSRKMSGDPSRRVVVFAYHSVHQTDRTACATPDLFRRQMSWLVEHCDIISLSEVGDALTDHNRQRPAVAVTFDDGNADNYDHALPVLAELGIPATFFVVSGWLDGDPAVAERMRWLAREAHDDVRPMEWQQVREMRAAGMEFGCHTYSHPCLANLDDAAAETELARGRQILEERLGEPVAAMAYPFGRYKRHFTDRTVRLVADAGFRYAGTVASCAVRPPSWPLTIPRFCVTRDDLATLREKVLGGHDIFELYQRREPLCLARIHHPEEFHV